jgi:4-hydroxyphenylacetate 3-monooxygenase
MTPMRSGQDYLASLRDGRRVVVNGDVVESVPDHPAFRGVVTTVASLYDFAADPANDMQFTAPETGRTALKPFMVPRSLEDLRSWRQAVERWARLTHGFLGRSPDHVGAFVAGFAGKPDLFDRGDRAFGSHVTAWHRRMLDESPFLSYVIVPPQVSRATTASGWEGDFIQVGVVDEDDDGIVLRGSQMLGTSSAVSDFVLVSCIKPLTPDDADHAVTAVVPISASGVKIYCRRPYAVGIPSSYDYPLSSRFDESDALVVFDDVRVPWEDVFVCRDVGALMPQWFGTAAHLLGNMQAQIRFAVKLQFLAGVARKICQVNQIDAIPSVQEKLGELAALVGTVEGLVVAAEAASFSDGDGVQRPNPRYLYSAIADQALTYPRALHILRELAGGGMLQLPSSVHELLVPEFREDMDRYVHSPGVPAEERVKLFKLAWDLAGSEFAGRHHQYEMFYAGAPFVAKGYAYRNFGYDEAAAAVDEFLGSYALPDADAAGPARPQETVASGS